MQGLGPQNDHSGETAHPPRFIDHRRWVDKELPLGTAYTVWTGIGAVGAVLVGIFAMGESRDPLRLLFVALIIVGIIGVKLTGNAH